MPAPTLVGDRIFHVLVFGDWQVDLHVTSGLPADLPPDLLDLNDTEEEVNTGLWSL